MRRSLLLTSLLALFACSGVLPSAERGMAGQWQSDDVSLVRGSLSEVYTFALDMTVEDNGDIRGVMDVIYFHTERSDEVRTIRQTITSPGPTGQSRIYLTGTNPIQTAGPELVGVYAPDDLDCALPDGDLLACIWGSDANGNPVAVTLQRR
ncbi:MAG: hypothetical protein AAF170_12855 [Bacteroidota bacterium]